MALLLILVAAAPAEPSHAAHPKSADFLCPVTARFSPRGGAEQVLVDTLRRARVRVRAAIYGLTSPAVGATFAELARAGVRVALKTDATQSAGRRQAALLARLSAAGVVVEVSRSRLPLHDKFAVVDGRWVVTGSFNWTANAERRNRENILVFDCPRLASSFEAEWESIDTRSP